MSWTSTSVTQNGNTTQGWLVSGSALTNHDAVVIKLEAGRSRVGIVFTAVQLSPIRYIMSVRVIGLEAVRFRFAAEAMN
jgi:hypothetical protein